MVLPVRSYEITDDDLVMMLECLKEDERRNRAMSEAGYSVNSGFVTDRLEELILRKLGFSGHSEYRMRDGHMEEEIEIVASLMQSNYYHGDKWPDAKSCIDNLVLLKERLTGLESVETILTEFG